jgi:hypothetical protein
MTEDEVRRSKIFQDGEDCLMRQANTSLHGLEVRKVMKHGMPYFFVVRLSGSFEGYSVRMWVNEKGKAVNRFYPHVIQALFFSGEGDIRLYNNYCFDESEEAKAIEGFRVKGFNYTTPKDPDGEFEFIDTILRQTQGVYLKKTLNTKGDGYGIAVYDVETDKPIEGIKVNGKVVAKQYDNLDEAVSKAGFGTAMLSLL